MTNEPNDPSDAGAPPGAPRPVPPSPELIALALQGLNEEEVLAELQEVEDGGYELEEFIGELEEPARRAGAPTAGKD